MAYRPPPRSRRLDRKYAKGTLFEKAPPIPPKNISETQFAFRFFVGKGKKAKNAVHGTTVTPGCHPERNLIHHYERNPALTDVRIPVSYWSPFPRGEGESPPSADAQKPSILRCQSYSEILYPPRRGIRSFSTPAGSSRLPLWGRGTVAGRTNSEKRTK